MTLQKSNLQQSWQLRYFENFSDPNSGWPVDDNPDREYSYYNGEYRIFVKSDNYWAMVRAGPKLSDAAVEVEARFATNIYGTYRLLFGISDDWSQIYTFEVDERSNYRLWKWDWFQERWTLVRGPTHSEHIRPRQELNRLRAERVGNDVSFYANGNFVTTERLPALAGERRMGIIAWSQSTPNMDVRFDNFKIFARVEASPTPISTQEPTATPTTPIATSTPTPTATGIPTGQPTPTATEVSPGEPLYEDDFSSPASGWCVADNDDYEMGYLGGEYRILVKTENLSAWCPAKVSFTDFDAQVQARHVGAERAKAYGLLFCYQDSDNFYDFDVLPNAGSYALWKRVNAEWVSLVSATESQAVHRGDAPNLLRVVVQGSEINLYI
ncbi:MAG: hypothetical protein ACE5LU_16705, partial [Anaerolineae bacterium]